MDSRLIRTRRIGSGGAAAGGAAALAAALLLVVLPWAAPSAAAPAPGAEALECLGCHEDEGMEKDLAAGGTLPLHVSPEAYALSVHGDMDCTDCHGAIDLEEHPGDAPIADLGKYRRRSSEACAECHDPGDTGEPMHRKLLAQKDAPACSECHDPHAVRPVGEWRAGMEQSEYCLTCHSRGPILTLGNGEAQLLTIDVRQLRESVHLSHDCSDCHSEFGASSHPVREFSSARDHSVHLAEVCRQCHEDKYGQYEGSIHHALIDGGNLAAPVCTDCHGFHSVKEAETIARLSGMPCRRCHEEVFEAFGASRHGQAVDGGHIAAPVCSSCHRAHEIRPAVWAEEMRKACSSCHPRAPETHAEWLPNSGLHLEAVACPACHAPRAEKAIELVLSSSGTGRPLTDGKLRSLTADDGTVMLGGDGVLDSGEVWNMLRKAGAAEGEGVALVGRIKVRSGLDAHRMEGKGSALRDCTVCHSPGASPYQSVSVTILRDDGRPLRYSTDGAVLGSAVSLGSVRGFYVLGGTRIRLLDFLLIAAVLGGMSAPALHLTARALARKPHGGETP